MSLAAPPLPRSTSLKRPILLSAIPRTWHLLSLDAPSVAVLWCWTFARATRLSLPWSSFLLLGTGTWIVYVADRVLDGIRPLHARALHERHLFHARHRLAFACGAMLASALLLWLIFTRMRPATRHEDTALFSLALIYFLLIHTLGSSVERWLPKELAVGLIFAGATAVPVWSRMSSEHAQLAPAVLLLGAICWLNCVGIERWENRAAVLHPNMPVHFTTGCAARYFSPTAIAISVVSAALALSAQHTRTGAHLDLVYLPCLLSSLLLTALDSHRKRVSALTLRIAADAALLTPLLFLPFIA